MKIKKITVFVIIAIFLFSFGLVSAQNQNQETQVKYCCEKTTYGAWCQEAPKEQCDTSGNLTAVPTSCESTSYCQLGCCYDSNEGTCMEKTPQRVCQKANGTWSPKPECGIQQCQLGCCLLGGEASFVTLTRCKKLSSQYGLQTDFRRNIGSETQCIALANQQDEGACVYEIDYSKTCQYTTRQECNSMRPGQTSNGTVTSNVTFHKDYLCSADKLGTNCGPTKETTCKDGKVYFVDSCGNKANIYDASKTYEKTPSYWRKKVSISEVCGGGGSKNSRSCGNCDYFSGSTCKDYRSVDAPQPNYGTKICASLDCKASITSDGQDHEHGESWCSTDSPQDSVGSRYFRHICMNGEEIIEPCSDYRQEVCIESGDQFTQAACRVNRWEDCYSQTEKKDCENEDKRDCKWTIDKKEVDYKTDKETGKRQPETIACLPEHPPGLKFWEEASQGQCSIANTQCVVEFVEEGLISKDEDCEENCECLESSWKEKQLDKCEMVGDCGAKSNFVGQSGNDKGYDIKKEDVEEEDSGGGGGLFGLSTVFRNLLAKLGLIEIETVSATGQVVKEPGKAGVQSKRVNENSGEIKRC